MKLLKIFSISSFVLCSLLLVTPVSAVTAPTSQKAVVIAQVNVREAKITSQEGNTLKISFNISNREGVQSGVKYSIKLIDGSSSKLTADEYVYPEVLSLSANTTIKKDIVYTAPASLNGSYTVMVLVKNYSGLPLGSSDLGKITLVATLKTVEILQDTCLTSIVGDKTGTKNTLVQGTNISSTENIILTCTAINNGKTSVTSIPIYETHLRTIYGDIVEQVGGDTTPISFKSGEKKTISLTLPRATSPQVYSVKVSLKEGNVSSNSVVVYYTIKGLSATIQNFSLDKDFYNKDDTAKISFFFIVSLDDKTPSPPITLIANITNEKGKNCINPINQILTKVGLVEISANIISDCNNPKASIELKDENGNVLDQKNLSFESKIDTNKTPAPKNNIILIFGLLLVLGVAIYFIILKKKNNEIINQ